MRLLHTMVRVGNLDRSIAFYTDVLGMKLLRRKDYPEGRFTNVFVGYGDERQHAVLELTHNWDTASYDLGNGYGLTPNARLHYARELADDTTRTTASFTGAPGTAMVNTSAKAGRDAGIVGVGASLSMPYGIAAYANYAAEVRRNVTGQAFTGGFRFNW